MPEIACPTCHKALVFTESRDLPFFPFCSKTCRLVDLGGWIDGRYAIPGETRTTDDAEDA